MNLQIYQNQIYITEVLPSPIRLTYLLQQYEQINDRKLFFSKKVLVIFKISIIYGTFFSGPFTDDSHVTGSLYKFPRHI